MEFENNQIDDLTVPNIEEVVFKPIQKKYRTVILLNYGLLYIVFFGLICLGIFLNFSLFSDTLFLVAVSTPFLIISMFLVFSLLSFKTRKYALRSKDVSYKSGLLVSKLTTVPFVRVQHIDVKQSFFSRKLGLASIEIFTAGESGGDLEIKGLKKARANSIREFIIAKINE